MVTLIKSYIVLKEIMCRGNPDISYRDLKQNYLSYYLVKLGKNLIRKENNL